MRPPRLVAVGLVAVVAVLGAPSAAVASTSRSGRVDVKFSETVAGTLTAAITPPRCSGSVAQGRVVTLDGKVGSNEYLVTVYLRGPQPTGTYPIGVGPQNESAVNIQKVATKASPTTLLFVAHSGTVTTKSATSGTIDAELLAPGRNPQPLHARGSWVCSTKPAKNKKKS